MPPFKHLRPWRAQTQSPRGVLRHLNTCTRSFGSPVGHLIIPLAVAVFAITPAACGGTGELTRSRAQTLIAESTKFKAPVMATLKDEKEFKVFPESPDESEQSVRERVLQMHLSSHPAWAVLRHLGYVDVNVSVVEPYRVKQVGGFSTPSPWVFNVELTLTGEGQKLARAHGLGTDRAVPLARREVVEVTGVREKEGQAAVDFTWKAVPSEAGRAFDPGTDTFRGLPLELQQALTESRGIGPFSSSGTQNWEQVFKATAGFQKYDDGWRLVSISGLQ